MLLFIILWGKSEAQKTPYEEVGFITLDLDNTCNIVSVKGISWQYSIHKLRDYLTSLALIQPTQLQETL